MGKYERRDSNNPLRRPRDYRADGTRRRKWGRLERKYRLSYRRHPVEVVLSTAASVAITAGLAYGSVQVGSILAGTQYEGSGWAVCDTPITWTKDGGVAYQGDIEWAFQQWADASGYKFSYAGDVPTTFDNATDTATTIASMNNNIAIKFVRDAASDTLSDTTVGIASPSAILGDSLHIVNGYAVFNIDWMTQASQKERRNIFVHEIGHALGLGHSTEKNDIMYPVVSNKSKFTQGDIDGLNALVKPCYN